MKYSVTKLLARTMMIAVLALFAGGAARAAEMSPDEIALEAQRYQAMSGIYKAEGFSEFPSGETPFYGHPGYGFYRLTQIRYRGRLIYEDQPGTQMGHSFSCGRLGTIYVELWMPGGPRGMLPFAWQDPFLLCRNGGEPSDADPFYVDITGDGKPEIKFGRMDAVSRTLFDNGVRKRVFSQAIIPSWIKKTLGGSFVEGQGGMAPGSAWIEPKDPIRERNR